jgi:putative transcriptional regulator
MNKIAEYRKKKNITQTELGEATGIPISSIAMYETDKRTPSLTRAMKIAKYFNTTTEKIFLQTKLTQREQ